jgi:hypothetical protein
MNILIERAERTAAVHHWACIYLIFALNFPRQQQLFPHQMAIRSIKQHASASGVERERARIRCTRSLMSAIINHSSKWPWLTKAIWDRKWAGKTIPSSSNTHTHTLQRTMRWILGENFNNPLENDHTPEQTLAPMKCAKNLYQKFTPEFIAKLVGCASKSK